MRLQLLFLAFWVILLGGSSASAQCPGGVCPINQYQPTFQYVQPVTYTVRENLVVTTLPVRRVSLIDCGENCGVGYAIGGSGQPQTVQTVGFYQSTESTPVYREIRETRERPRLFQRVRLFSSRCSGSGCR